MSLAARVNGLRTELLHLDSQVAAGRDTNAATLEQAVARLRGVEAELEAAEGEARALPECAYLFRPRRRGGGTTKNTPQSAAVVRPNNTDHHEQGEDMPRKSNAEALEEVLADLKKAEKSMGSVKWALEGAGAEKNPPSPERKAALAEKLAGLQATVAGLREKRDALKPKAKKAEPVAA